MKHLRFFLFLFPFVCFFCGYFFISTFFHKAEIKTPVLLGKSFQTCVHSLAQEQLSIRFLGERDDAELPAGTILDQIPKPGTKIKRQQSILVTVSKKPTPLQMPEFIGKTASEITDFTQGQSLSFAVVWVKSPHRTQRCFAQSPAAGLGIVDGKALVYCSSGPESLVLMPNFCGRPLGQVQEILKKMRISFEILPPKLGQMVQENSIICEQKPIAGSIFDSQQGVFVQLKI